jgi:hypothetical protein
MNELKLSSILIIAVLLVIVFYALKYIVFPLLHLALGIAAGLLGTVLTVLVIVLIYLYIKQALKK